MKPLLSLLLILGIQPIDNGAPDPPSVVKPASPSPEDMVRKELEANYQKIVDGFKKDDPSTWEGFLTPGFQLKLFNGQVKDRKWVTEYVRNNAKAFKVSSLSMGIKSLTIEGDSAAAMVEQKSSRTFVDEQRQTHQLDVGAVQREVWTKTRDGMRLKFVEEKELLYLKQDDKPKRP